MAKQRTSVASRKIGTVIEEMKAGTLRSGRSGKKVRNPKQALAIGLSEARKAGARIPKKANTTPKRKAKKKAKKAT